MKQRFTITLVVETENDERISIHDVDESAHDTLTMEDFLLLCNGKQVAQGVIVSCVVDEVK